MAGIDQEDLHRECLALNLDFSSSSHDPLNLRRLAHVGVKDGYSSKNGYFTAVGSSRVKRSQIGTYMPFIITSTSDEPLSGVNIDDLKLT